MTRHFRRIPVEHLTRRRGPLHQDLSNHQEVCSPLFWCGKSGCGFWGPPWCDLKVDPEIYCACGSYYLLVSNVAYQMKQEEQNNIQFIIPLNLSEMSLQYEMGFFATG